MSKVVDIAWQVVTPIAAQCEVEVIDIEYKKTVNGMELTFFIDTDKEGGISLEDCERLHRLIDPAIDLADPTDGAQYQLSVSSPGIDRPLKTARDYKKNMGKEVIVSLYEKCDIGKKFVAILRAFDLENGKITFEYNGNILDFELQNIALIKPEIKF